jgi:DNA protecting protein DprA
MSGYEIKTLKIDDPLYPVLLKEINNPPKVLYYIGKWPKTDLFPLAVVGSRESDVYGERVIKNILSKAILDKIVIVSGLAKGIDALAHKIAKHTIAVLGTGLDEASFYPKENLELYHQIIKNGGLIISEFPIGTKPKPQNFPQRNRIVAGLSRAAIIIQAKIRSGALITARLALEGGREVLAVPGSIFNELSAGPHLLIAQGAIPVTSSAELNEICQRLTCYE